MTPDEYAAQVFLLQHAFKTGQIGNGEFVQRVAWLTFVAQGVTHPTVSQLEQRMHEVLDAAEFMGERPTVDEVLTATAFISPAPE
ncbi:hypothetical protein ACP6C7_18905 [Mycolicibacterium septicum]|uniref:Uncharacterized protein n=1 Tax=Mycolicibacterium septicum TaxID=98668 RepID=A0ABW9LW18_9MYCO